MQNKSYNFELPRTITRDQWRKIHGGARKMRHSKGGIDRIAQKYGVQMLRILGGSHIIFFWDIASHKEHDRAFFQAAIRGNSQGLTRHRTGGMVKSIKDPKHPQAAFLNGGGNV